MFPIYVPGNTGGPTFGTILKDMEDFENFKKKLKEEGKDKDKKKGGPTCSVFAVALVMLLLSPITGPLMSWFFHLGLSFIH
jgi:hypothetical protein